MAQDTAPAALHTDRSAPPIHPVESTVLRRQAWQRGTEEPPAALCEAVTSRRRGHPQATGEEDARRSQRQG
jgi:hypothetical protein